MVRVGNSTRPLIGSPLPIVKIINSLHKILRSLQYLNRKAGLPVLSCRSFVPTLSPHLLTSQAQLPTLYFVFRTQSPRPLPNSTIVFVFFSFNLYPSSFLLAKCCTLLNCASQHAGSTRQSSFPPSFRPPSLTCYPRASRGSLCL